MAEIIHGTIKRAHAIALRRASQKAEADEKRIEDRPQQLATDASVQVSTAFDEIFLTLEGEDVVLRIPLTRKMLKQFKSDYDWLWAACRSPDTWNRGHNSVTGY